jgi:hypothetical protein
MHTFTLTNSSPESEEFEHSGGRISVLVQGDFDSCSVGLQLKANNVSFIQLSDDDFRITDDDVLNVDLPAYCTYKIVADSVGISTGLNVTIL